jgi:hypothetical protein
MGRIATSRVAQVIELLAMGNTQRSVAEQTGLNKGTICRMALKKDIAEQVSKRRDELLAEWKGQLRLLVPQAFEALSNAMKSGNHQAAMKGVDLLFKALKLTSEEQADSGRDVQVGFSLTGLQQDEDDIKDEAKSSSENVISLRPSEAPKEKQA